MLVSVLMLSQCICESIDTRSQVNDSHVPQAAMYIEVQVHGGMVDACKLHLTSSPVPTAEGRPGVAEADKQQIRSNLVPVIIRSSPIIPLPPSFASWLLDQCTYHKMVSRIQALRTGGKGHWT